jgi:amidohydrolase
VSPLEHRLDVDGVFDEMVDTRRALHAHPELGFEEETTTQVIRTRLAALGLTEERAGTATGAAFSLMGGRPGRAVVLRADIDALPVHEETDVPFHSAVDGRMHACGHDAHTAALLGAARVLAGRAEELTGRYLFIFQPCEEELEGARRMIEGGVLAGFEDARLVGHHVTSIMPVGYLGVRAGTALSEAHSLRITFEGTGGHGAVPHAGGDVVRAAAGAVGRLGDVVAGLSYEGTDCVCGAGVIHAGTAVNVVPVRAVVAGTLRTFTDAQRDEALGRLRALCDRVASDYGVRARLELPSHTRAVVNDPAMTALVQRAATRTVPAERVIAMGPVGPSDDVSEFLVRMPGCYFFVGGARADGSSGMHHSPTFAIDEEALRVSCAVMVEAATAMAAPGGPTGPHGD